jgi:hypothetical protein
MRALSVLELLSVWENGINQTPVERGLALLLAACPDVPRSDLAGLTIGQRDARLLTLREWTFGPQLESVVPCPQCKDKVELVFEVESVRANSPPETFGAPLLRSADYSLQMRPPNSEDVAAIAAEKSVEQKRQLLFDRCLLAASRNGQPVSADELPPEAIEAAAVHLAEADPQADVQLNISCPSCGNNWTAAFDILAFFWHEIEAWACRALLDVNTLARAYGWSEHDILALTPARRRLYLEMVNA